MQFTQQPLPQVLRYSLQSPVGQLDVLGKLSGEKIVSEQVVQDNLTSSIAAQSGTYSPIAYHGQNGSTPFCP